MRREQVEAAVVTWAKTSHPVPEGGKVEAFAQGGRTNKAAITWVVYISDAADTTVSRLEVWTYAKAGVVTIYATSDHAFLGTVNVPAKHGGGIRLSQTAPWNPALKNQYRTRYAEVDGHYFRVAAEDLNGLWFVDEISQDGRSLRSLPFALNLDQARSIIAADMGQDPAVGP